MKIRKFKSIRTRLTLLFAVIMSTIILVSDFFLYGIYKKNLITSIDNSLYMIAEEIEHTILKDPQRLWRQEIRNVNDEFIVNRFFTQIVKQSMTENEPDNVIIRSEVLSGSDLPRLNTKINYLPVFTTIFYKKISAHPIRVILFPVIKEGISFYVIQIGTSLKKINHSLDQLLLIFLLSGPIIIILSSLISFFIISRAFVPVKDVIKLANKISTEDLSERIDLKEKEDEIGDLVKAFNHMINRLQNSIQKIKQFSSDVSHELKTPLTIIRGEIEIALRKKRSVREYNRVLNSIHEETIKFEGIISDLLLLSRIETQVQQNFFTSIPLFEIVLNKLKNIQNFAENKKIKLKIAKIEPLYIYGIAEFIKRLLMNLIDNAIKYTPEHGTIEIGLEARDNLAVLTVKDSGIGIAEDQFGKIFDRFYRVDQARSSQIPGSGLGLAIVKHICTIHQADIQIKSKPGKGTTFIIRFPLERKENDQLMY